MPLTVFLNQLSSTSYKSSIDCDAHLSITQCFITDLTADSVNTLTVIIFHAILPPGDVITNYIPLSLQLFSLFSLSSLVCFQSVAQSHDYSIFHFCIRKYGFEWGCDAESRGTVIKQKQYLHWMQDIELCNTDISELTECRKREETDVDGPANFKPWQRTSRIFFIVKLAWEH